MRNKSQKPSYDNGIKATDEYKPMKKNEVIVSSQLKGKEEYDIQREGVFTPVKLVKVKQSPYRIFDCINNKVSIV